MSWFARRHASAVTEDEAYSQLMSVWFEIKYSLQLKPNLSHYRC